MMVLYNLLVMLVIALVVKLGITYTDYEEYFVMIGVLNVIYLICLVIYVTINNFAAQ